MPTPGSPVADRPSLTLQVHTGRLAVVRRPAGAPVPSWAAIDARAGEAAIHAVTRTADETSLLLDEAAVPADEARVERGFRALAVAGTLDFSLVGILADLSAILATAGVSIFVISTFDTDWVLVRESELDSARSALAAAGHSVKG